MREHEFEPIPGLPEELPEGEHIVWQGTPRASAIANRVFYARTVAIYFVLLMVVHIIFRMMDGSALAEILLDTVWQLVLAGIAVGLLTLAGRLYANTCRITFTNKRLVLRSGVALPMIVNIPWEGVASAGLRVCADGTGDVLITPKDDRRLYYLMLWPFVRPWRFGRVEPLLRGIEEPQAVARRLAEVIEEERSADNFTPRATRVPTHASDREVQGVNEQPLPAS